MPAISLAVLACVAGVVVLSVMYSREKKAVKELNDRLLLNESRELAFHGEIMLEEGRLADAEKLALSILPKDLNNPDRPYSVDAERLLRNCYIQREASPIKLNTETYIVGIDEKYAYGPYERYDLQSGEVEELCSNGVVTTALSPDFKTLIYQLDSILYVMDVDSKVSKAIYELPEKEFIENLQFDQLGTRAAIGLATYHEYSDFYRALYIYDVESGELIDLDTRDDYTWADIGVSYSFTNDGRWLSEFNNFGDDDAYCVGVWDLTDYSWKCSWTIGGSQLYAYDSVADIYTVDSSNSLLVAGSNISDSDMPLISGLVSVSAADVNKYSGDIAVLHRDSNDNQYVSVYDKEGNLKASALRYYDIACSFVSEDVICLYGDYRVQLYDAKTLEEILTLYADDEIDDVFVSEDCTKVLVYAGYQYILYDLSNTVAMDGVVVDDSDDYFVLSNGEVRSAKDFELLMTVPATDCVSIAGDYLALLLYGDKDNLQVFDLKSGERKYVYTIKVGGYDYGTLDMSSTGRYVSYDGIEGEEVMDLSTGEIIYDPNDWVGLHFCEDGVHVHGMSHEGQYRGMEFILDLEALNGGNDDELSDYGLVVSRTGRFLIKQSGESLAVRVVGDNDGKEILLDAELPSSDYVEHRFSESDDFFAVQTGCGVKVYETETWTTVFEKDYPDLYELYFKGDSYLSVVSEYGRDMKTDVYQTKDWTQVFSYEGYNPVFESPYPIEEMMWGYVNDVFCPDDSRVYAIIYGDEECNRIGKLIVWDKNIGGFVTWEDIHDLGENGVYMTGEGDLIFSSYSTGVRKIDMPDLQTLINQTRERYGM